MVNLSLTEKFFLLAAYHRSKAGRYPGNELDYGIVGAILIELAEGDYVDLKEGKLIPVAGKTTGIDYLDYPLRKMSASRKLRTVKKWVLNFGMYGGKYRGLVRASLLNKGVIKVEERRFLWIIPYKTYPLSVEQNRQDVLDKLYRDLQEDNMLDKQSVLLGALTGGCRLWSVFRKRSQYRKVRDRLKKLSKPNYLADEVGETIDAVKSAILMAALTSVNVTAVYSATK